MVNLRERIVVNELVGETDQAYDVEGQICTPIDVRDISTRHLFHVA